MNKLLVIGAGGHGKVVADTAREMALWDLISFVDSRYPEQKKCSAWQVTAADLPALSDDYIGADFIVAIGNNELRLKLYSEAIAKGFTPVNVIHPFSYISPDVSLGKGIVIFAGSVINIDSSIGDASIINTGATIDHDCFLSAGVHISPGVNLAGGVSVGQCSWVGIGASVKQLVEIGDNVIVGAGSAVVSNIESDVTVVGVPARSVV
jgi:sugar O-acyltransferase (sialic acid O-acetyltransferase NeuD family)